MIDIKRLRENPERFKASVVARHLDPNVASVDRLLATDEKWRHLEANVSDLRAERNKISSELKKLPDERAAAIERVKGLKGELGQLEADLETLSAERKALLYAIPNLLHPDAPQGKTDAENRPVKTWGEPRAFDFEPRDHVELGELTDTLDFERGAKVVGSRFYYLKNEAVLLEQALIALAVSTLRKRNFTLIATPDLARDEILLGIGFNPRGPETQIYSIENAELSLVGTAEITVGGYHAGEILDGAQLPLCYMGLSHCFRTEAGTYGRESRGLYRVHQFTKAEMFILCRPEDSERMHAELLAIEEELLQALELPYQVVDVCAGDLGAPAARKYDIEAWMPGRNGYGEVTSCSNCTDFQSRRLNVRFREDAQASPSFVHMLNGTALAVSRCILAIYENFQERDGSIPLPKALHPFLHGVTTIGRRS